MKIGGNLAFCYKPIFGSGFKSGGHGVINAGRLASDLTRILTETTDDAAAIKALRYLALQYEEFVGHTITASHWVDDFRKIARTGNNTAEYHILEAITGGGANPELEEKWYRIVNSPDLDIQA